MKTDLSDANVTVANEFPGIWSAEWWKAFWPHVTLTVLVLALVIIGIATNSLI